MYLIWHLTRSTLLELWMYREDLSLCLQPSTPQWHTLLHPVMEASITAIRIMIRSGVPDLQSHDKSSAFSKLSLTTCGSPTLILTAWSTSHIHAPIHPSLYFFQHHAPINAVECIFNYWRIQPSVKCLSWRSDPHQTIGILIHSLVPQIS